jgi:hypothetical protein
MHIIERQDRIFVALRRVRPGSRGTQPISHAASPHRPHGYVSVQPGPSLGWAEPPAAEVTCPACLQRLERLEVPRANSNWHQRKSLSAQPGVASDVRQSGLRATLSPPHLSRSARDRAARLRPAAEDGQSYTARQGQWVTALSLSGRAPSDGRASTQVCAMPSFGRNDRNWRRANWQPSGVEFKKYLTSRGSWRTGKSPGSQPGH